MKAPKRPEKNPKEMDLKENKKLAYYLNNASHALKPRGWRSPVQAPHLQSLTLSSVQVLWKQQLRRLAAQRLHPVSGG